MLVGMYSPVCAPMVLHEPLGLLQRAVVIGSPASFLRKDRVEELIWGALEVVRDRYLNVVVEEDDAVRVTPELSLLSSPLCGNSRSSGPERMKGGVYSTQAIIASRRDSGCHWRPL
jgi:hypothetical protein